eukprot:2874745-Rhodomonas_salina.2
MHSISLRTRYAVSGTRAGSPGGTLAGTCAVGGRRYSEEGSGGMQYAVLRQWQSMAIRPTLRGTEAQRGGTATTPHCAVLMQGGRGRAVLRERGAGGQRLRGLAGLQPTNASSRASRTGLLPLLLPLP